MPKRELRGEVPSPSDKPKKVRKRHVRKRDVSEEGKETKGEAKGVLNARGSKPVAGKGPWFEYAD